MQTNAASLSYMRNIHGFFRLLAEDENSCLACEADFLDLSAFSEQHGIISGLGTAVFPPAFGFGNNLLALLNGGLVSIDLQPVFACR